MADAGRGIDPPAVLDSIDRLVARADAEPVPITDGAGKSGATLLRLSIDGAPHVLKVLDPAHDWTLRAMGSQQHVATMWERGLLHRLPPCLHQPIVAVAREPGPGGVDVVGLLMEDVGATLVPVSDEPIAFERNERCLADMAAMHAAFWGGGAELELVPLELRYLELSPRMSAREAALGSSHLVPRLVGEGWERFEAIAPEAASVVLPLLDDPSPLVDAVAEGPLTFVHGNWKLDNLGTDPQGRTVVLDWEAPGRAPAAADLAWYLAINCRRLPTTKEASIESYRSALEASGVDTGGWWEQQLALSLLGATLLFGWEKALGGRDDELAWWEGHALAAADLL